MTEILFILLKALAFSITGALLFEGAMILLRRRQTKVSDGSSGSLANIFLLPQPPPKPPAQTEILHAALEYLTASDTVVSHREVPTETYEAVRASWLKLWTAIKRESARRTLVTTTSKELDGGLRELLEIGDHEDLERIERLLATGHLTGQSKELAVKAVEKIRARAAAG